LPTKVHINLEKQLNFSIFFSKNEKRGLNSVIVSFFWMGGRKGKRGAERASGAGIQQDKRRYPRQISRKNNRKDSSKNYIFHHCELRGTEQEAIQNIDLLSCE
jgi:hypothetical protein